MPSVALAQESADLAVLLARNQVILTALPSVSDRSDRLRGTLDVANSPAPFMKALPGVISGSPVPANISLAAIDRMAGNEKPRLYDLWLKAKANPLQWLEDSPDPALLTTGVDYLVQDRLLLGGFVQADARPSLALAGWSLGGFGTMRVTDGLYLDVVGARGAGGRQAEGADVASNWLMTTSLTGKWTADHWTFGPQARITYFAALAPAGIDKDGAVLAAQRQATGELAIGPSVSYKLTTVDDVVVSTGLTLDTKARLAAETDSDLTLDGLRSGLEGTLNIDLPTGARWKSSFGYQGIGQESRSFNAKGTLTVPLR